MRYQQRKNDSLDAEGAARSVLSGQAIATPKTQTGSVEMIRHLKVARDTAVKSLSVVMVMLKTLTINAPAELRDSIDQPLSDCSAFAYRSMDQREGRVDQAHAACRPGPITSTTASAKAAMRSLARCWLMLHDETVEHDKALKALVEAKVPSLMASHGIATSFGKSLPILAGQKH